MLVKIINTTLFFLILVAVVHYFLLWLQRSSGLGSDTGRKNVTINFDLPDLITGSDKASPIASNSAPGAEVVEPFACQEDQTKIVDLSDLLQDNIYMTPTPSNLSLTRVQQQAANDLPTGNLDQPIVGENPTQSPADFHGQDTDLKRYFEKEVFPKKKPDPTALDFYDSHNTLPDVEKMPKCHTRTHTNSTASDTTFSLDTQLPNPSSCSSLYWEYPGKEQVKDENSLNGGEISQGLHGWEFQSVYCTV